MAILKFGKTICITSLLSLGLMSNAYAVDDEDVLGQFLEQKFATQQVQNNTPLQTAEYDPLAAYMQPSVNFNAAPVNAVHTNTIQYQAAQAGPMLKAQSALIMNAKTGQVLYQKNMSSVRSIASISKLMSAMVLLDAHLDMNEQITITEAEIDRLKGTGSRLSVGTTLTRAQLLHLAAMNAKARSLGMANSRFYEPTGLDPRNVSTALELGKMVQAASHYAKIRELTTSNYGQAYTSNGKLQQYKNTNVLVREGLMNITLQKTGYIREAGRSMVLQAKMGQTPVVIVVLGSATSASRASDARSLGNIAQTTL